MKKLLALLLVAVMLVSVLAGCNTEKPAGTTEGPAGTTGAPAGTTEAPAGTTEAPVAEYKGELPLTTEDITITVGMPQHANTEDYETNELTKWIEEQTGIKLDFVYYSYTADEWKQQFGLDVNSGNELPDILWSMPLGTSLHNEYGADGYLLDLTDLFNEYSYYWHETAAEVPQSIIDNALLKAKSPADGKMYSWPSLSYSKSADNANALVNINQKWLEAVGMENPTNVEELYEVLKAFKEKDPNGNGKADEIPAIFYGGYRGALDQWVINAYIYNHEDYIFNVTDGQLWTAYNTDEYREALKYLNKLYSEGLISDLSYSIAEDAHAEMTAIFTPADGVAIAGLVGAHPTVATETENMVLAEYTAANILEDETGKGGYAPLASPSPAFNSYITADCEHPELAAKLLDFMHSSEFFLRGRYGLPGVHWDWAKEGELDSEGNQADWVLLDNTAYTNQNNILWHSGRGLGNQIGAYFTRVADPVGEMDWSQVRSALNTLHIERYYEGKQPDELAHTIVYNAEEDAIRAEVSVTLNDFIEEQRALFISGAQDPNDDAAWKTYLENLDAYGLSRYMEAAQAAYTRNAE